MTVIATQFSAINSCEDQLCEPFRALEAFETRLGCGVNIVNPPEHGPSSEPGPTVIASFSNWSQLDACAPLASRAGFNFFFFQSRACEI